MRQLITSLILICSMHLVGQDASVATHELIVTQFGYEAGLQSSNVTALFQDSRGVFWVGTRGAGLFQFNMGRFVAIPEIPQNKVGYVTGLCETADGQIAIKTPSELFVYDGRQIISKGDQTASCMMSIAVPSQADEGNSLCHLELGLGALWVGTKTGLKSYSPIDSLWQDYSDAAGLLDDAIQTLMYDHNNVLWIGTRTNGLLQYIGPAHKTPDITLSTEVTESRYNADLESIVLKDKNDRFYTLDQTNGLAHIPAFDSIEIENFFIDGHGYYWLEGRDGKVRIVNVDSTESNLSTLNLNKQIKAFSFDRFNTVWIITEGEKLYFGNALQGLNQYQLVRSYANLPGDELVDLIAYGGNQVYRIGVESVGVIKNDKYSSMYSSEIPIRCAHVDDEGILWIGTEGNGIIKLEQGKPPRKIQPPASWRGLKIIFLQKKGSILWVGTNRAVYQFVLDHAQRGVLRSARVFALPRAALRAKDYAALGDKAICVFSGNAIYFLRQQGFTLQGSTPSVFLSSVNLRDEPLSKSKYRSTTGAFAKQVEPLSLGYRENTLTMSWQGISAIAGTLTYAYRINPQEDWSTPSGRTALQLAELAPGKYLFDVQVCDENGNCSTLKSPWQFEIRKALWQNLWFWLIVAIAAFSGVLLGIKYREKKIRDKAERDLEIVKSKLHTLELEQKAMQLQMNPHFIFNAIQTIHHQLLNNKVNKAANSLVSFSTLMRSMLEMSRTEKVSLEDELEFLSAYVRVEQICRSEPIEFIINASDDIEPFDIMIPSMMLQPLVENAIKYGGKRITLDVSLNGKYVNFKVSDNGPGFPDEMLISEKSIALNLLRQRVAHMPGNGFVKYYNIVEDGTVNGASVELNVIETS